MALLEVFMVDLTVRPPTPVEPVASAADDSKMQQSIRRLREWKAAPRPSTRLLPRSYDKNS